MGKLTNLHKALVSYDPDKILSGVLKDNEDFINDLVRDRLNEKGEDSTGKKLKTKRAKRGVYANRTIFDKIKKGQPYKHVTLKDTGAFQKSFELQIKKEMFNIKSDTEKEDGKIEDNIDLTNVITLSKQEQTNVVNEIRPDFIQETRKNIGI